MFWSLLLIFLGLASARKREYATPEHLENLRETGQYEEYARLLGVDVSLVRPNGERRSEASIFNHVSRFGDYLVPEVDEEEERTGINFDKYRGSKWPFNQIPVAFSNEFTRDEVLFIVNACRDWNNRVNLKLVDYNGHRDYVLVIKGNGCYSYLGRTYGQQPLSLEYPGCFTNGTVQHEFMHAAGFAHEHNRMDRDGHLRVLWDNIPRDWHSQYEKVNPDDFVNVGNYDPESVMHYPRWAPGTGKDAFEILNEDVDPDKLGQHVGLSDEDVEKINYLYP